MIYTKEDNMKAIKLLETVHITKNDKLWLIEKIVDAWEEINRLNECHKELLLRYNNATQM